jgi:hypothetical protein
MLDRDLAEMYEVETRVLNQAVSRNIGRFPEDFMFELTLSLQKPEGFRVKASEDEVAVLYFESSATQHLKSSGFPEG